MTPLKPTPAKAKEIKPGEVLAGYFANLQLVKRHARAKPDTGPTLGIYTTLELAFQLQEQALEDALAGKVWAPRN